jgi:glutathione S-transferase
VPHGLWRREVSAVIELWHCPDARSFRPLWMLEEMGLPYRLHLLPFPPRYQSPDFLDVNPLGTVPYLRDGETELTESAGMLHWLAETRGPTALAVAAHETDFDRYVNYLFQSDATLTFPQTIVLRYRVLEPEEKRQPKVASDYEAWFLARMTWVERGLADGRAYLAAGRFTAADIAVGYACLLAGHLGLLPGLGGRTRAWWASLEARDGFQRAKAAQAAAPPNA